MKKNPLKRKADIDVYGNIAAGKTQLAAAIWRHVKGADREVNKDFAEQLEIAANGNPGIRSEYTENFSMIIDNTKLNFNIHKGETLRLGNKESKKPLHSDYKLDQDRIFLAVVNPFTLDRDIAFQASCAMIAWLQSNSLTIENSVRLAFAVMFNMTEFSSDNTAFVRLFASEYANEKIFFNYAGESFDLRYSVGHNQQGFESGRSISISNFGQDLRIAVNGIIDKHLDGHSQLSDVLEEIEHSMLVLSHLDLNKYMLGFDVGNFDKACDLLYRDGDRTKGVQLFGRYVTTSFQWEVVERKADGMSIVQFRNDYIKYRSDSPDFPNTIVKNLINLTIRKQNEFFNRTIQKRIMYVAYILIVVGFIGLICSVIVINSNQLRSIFAIFAIITAIGAWRIIALTNIKLKI